MSNPNRTSYAGPPLGGPGIMWVNSTPKLPLTEGVFNQWYEKVHIPDVINAKPGPEGCIAAWRFKCKDTSRPRSYLALYAVPDMGFIQSPELGKVSQYHKMLPEGGPSHKFIDFDTRFYRRVQVLEKARVERKPGIGRVIKSTAIQPGPGMDAEFDCWYREEHLEQVSEMPGWRKSTRYELIFKVQSSDDPNWEEAPKYLAIHEFEEGTEVKSMPKDAWTDMTRKMVEGAMQIDEGTFDIIWGMGDEDEGL